MTDSRSVFNRNLGVRPPYHRGMRLLAAAVLASTLWGCDAKTPPVVSAPVAAPSTTATVKIDDV